MHLIYLTYQTSYLSLAYLRCAQNTYISRQWGHPTQSLFCDIMLNISCNLLHTALEGENRMSVWVQNGCKCIGCLPLIVVWVTGAAAHCPASPERIGLYIPSPGKDPNSKFVSTECISLLHHLKVKTSLSWTILSRELSGLRHACKGIQAYKMRN